MTRKRQDNKPPILSFPARHPNDALLRARTSVLLALEQFPADAACIACARADPRFDFMGHQQKRRALAEHVVMSILVDCELMPKPPNTGHG